MTKNPKKHVLHRNPFCIFMLSASTEAKEETTTEKEVETETAERDKKGKEDPRPWKKKNKK